MMPTRGTGEFTGLTHEGRPTPPKRRPLSFQLVPDKPGWCYLEGYTQIDTRSGLKIMRLLLDHFEGLITQHEGERP